MCTPDFRPVIAHKFVHDALFCVQFHCFDPVMFYKIVSSLKTSYYIWWFLIPCLIRHGYCDGTWFCSLMPKNGITHAGIRIPTAQSPKLTILPVRGGPFRDIRNGLWRPVRAAVRFFPPLRQAGNLSLSGLRNPASRFCPRALRRLWTRVSPGIFMQASPFLSIPGPDLFSCGNCKGSFLYQRT
jgi:hypothetical protein